MALSEATMSLSVMPPIAETTTTIAVFLALALTICVTFWMFSEEPTEVPPNFKTFIIDELIRDRCC